METFDGNWDKKKRRQQQGEHHCNKYVLEVISDNDQLRMMEQYAIDYAHSIGLVTPISDPPDGKLTNIYAIPPPIVLCPSPFPRELYDHAVNVQQAMNELYFRVASDHDFLMDAYKDVVKAKKMSHNPKEAEREMEKAIFIPGDCWLKVFDFLSPSQLGLGIAMISRRFDYFVDEHFKTRRWALKNKIQIKGEIGMNGAKQMKIVNSDRKELPIPQNPLPNKVTGFRSIEINYFD
ncbi:hypothetical protein niasHT_029874 [Heterodera trifolii]|uniref:F-box domain-containing protein n=1 Tax=Heterodera trifolii TaxID=157864 RepID=A0ABD2KBL3_9BILA